MIPVDALTFPLEVHVFPDCQWCPIYIIRQLHVNSILNHWLIYEELVFIF